MDPLLWWAALEEAKKNDRSNRESDERYRKRLKEIDEEYKAAIKKIHESD